jgi:hypothetical protein
MGLTMTEEMRMTKTTTMTLMRRMTTMTKITTAQMLRPHRPKDKGGETARPRLCTFRWSTAPATPYEQ